MLHISDFLERKPFDLQTSAIYSKSIDQLERAFIQTEGWPLFGDSGFLPAAAAAAAVDWELNCRSESLSTPTVGIAECPVHFILAHFIPSVLTSPAPILLISALFLFCSFLFLSYCIN